MCSGEIGVKREKDGTIFIDRSGEHFDIILNYLRDNSYGIHDFTFDENTRKSLIKEAEYYNLASMRDILNFKKTTLPTVDDGKAEIIDVIERVVHNKKRLKAILSDTDSTSRRKIPKTIKDLDLKKQGRNYNYTQRPLEFENAHWDNVTFEHAYFTENTTFKNCSFLQAKFKNCVFGNKNTSTNINFHNCDLICTDFSSSSFIGFLDFNGSDLRCADFRGIDNLAFLIATDSVKIINAEYFEKAQFDEDAWSAIVERSKSFDVSHKS